MRLRVSATDIDALRYFLASEDGDLDTLLAQLRRETQPTESMLAGTALHTALERADAGEFETLEADGFAFDLAIEGEIALPEIREMKGTRDYQIGNVLVTLVGKVDAVHGLRVYDHKFTQRFDPDRFLNSMQWRVYLEVFAADMFQWNVFESRETEPRRYLVHHLHTLTMHRYPGMFRDVEAALHEFVAFAKIHMPERLSPPVAMPFSEAVLDTLADRLMG